MEETEYSVHDDLRNAQSVLRLLMRYAKERLADSEDMRRVYATIARYNLGSSYMPGGSGDRFIITPEMVEAGK